MLPQTYPTAVPPQYYKKHMQKNRTGENYGVFNQFNNTFIVDAGIITDVDDNNDV